MTDDTHMMANNTPLHGAVTAPKQWLAWFFPILILAMVGAMLSWNAHIRYREFETYQQRLMESSVNGTAAELGVFINELRRSVHLFSDKERARIDLLSANPDDEKTHEQLDRIVRTHFPEAFAFTLADNNGEPLLDDFDGLVGDICVNDMRTFSSQREHSKVYIHPNPVTYHFDIMVDREHNGDPTGIFFVSFTTDILSRILKHGEVPGHKLLLLKQDIPGLIEVTSEGPRIKLQREFKLTSQEMDRIGYSAPVSGASWALVDLPDPDLYMNMRNTIRREAIFIMLAFLAVNSSMLWMLLRSQSRRRKLEHLYHHDPVTGLPNRHLFLERFTHMASAHADSGASFTLLLIDVGRFRRLKDTFFEQKSDDILTKAAAERIEKALCGARIVARIGDNNFAVLFSGRTAEQVESDSQNVLAALKKPFGTDNDTLLQNPCVGNAQYPEDGEDIQALIRQAGIKIYGARQQHSNGHAPQTGPESPSNPVPTRD